MNLTRTGTPTTKYDLLAAVSHEIDEVLGLGSALNGLKNGDPTPTGAVWGMDLYRYNATRVRSFNTSAGTHGLLLH